MYNMHLYLPLLCSSFVSGSLSIHPGHALPEYHHVLFGRRRGKPCASLTVVEVFRALILHQYTSTLPFFLDLRRRCCSNMSRPCWSSDKGSSSRRPGQLHECTSGFPEQHCQHDVGIPSGPETCFIVDAVVGHVRARSTRRAAARA